MEGYSMVGKTLTNGSGAPLTGNATPGDVVAGATFYSDDPKTKQTGTMTNRGAWTATIDPGESVTIPIGFHNGKGKVTANSGGYPGLPSGYKYVTGSKTITEVNASATTFPMSITFSGGGFQTPYAQEGTGQVLFGSTVVYTFTISGGGHNIASGGMAFIDVFAACGRSFATLMDGNKQLSLSTFTTGGVTVTAWIEPV